MKQKMIELPLISVQPTAFDVIKDVTNRQVAHESFWVSYQQNPEQQTVHDEIDVAKPHDAVELRSLNDRISSKTLSNNSLEVVHNGSIATVSFPRRKFDKYTQQSNMHDITSIDVSPGNNLLVVGDNTGGVNVVSVNEASVRRKLEGHYVHTSVVKFFASGQVVVSGGSDLMIKIWSAIDGSNPRTLTGHKASITDIQPIGRGRNILSSAEDSTIRLWECGSGQNIHTFECQSLVNSIVLLQAMNGTNDSGNGDLEFEIEGKVVVGACRNGIVGYDVRSKDALTNIPFPNAVKVAANSSSSIIACGSSTGEVGIWDWRNMKELGIIKKSNSEISCLSFLNNSLVVGSSDGIPVCLDVEKITSNEKKSFVNYLGGDDVPVTCGTSTSSGVYLAGKTGSLRFYDL